MKKIKMILGAAAIVFGVTGTVVANQSQNDPRECTPEDVQICTGDDLTCCGIYQNGQLVGTLEFPAPF